MCIYESQHLKLYILFVPSNRYFFHIYRDAGQIVDSATTIFIFVIVFDDYGTKICLYECYNH